MKVLETERLFLRHLSEREDDAFLLDLLNGQSFLQNVGDRGVRTREDTRAFIAKGPGASYAQHGFGLYLVELKGIGIPVGICGLLRRDGLEFVEIGFAFFGEVLEARLRPGKRRGSFRVCEKRAKTTGHKGDHRAFECRIHPFNRAARNEI